ncbi:MAG TPA: DNA polymerase III subunit gamma/tau, partial [Sutterellaceae bacterium]|nr:DNA polymerase III subunit gamma/tau [Sutterellaceae bacterium]
MAYQALYRKYRPTTFNEVVGQETIIQTLKNAKAQDRVAHAYLFCGPRGTGKTTIAKIFARMLNCTSTEDNQPCGECENCKMALNGSHPDIIEIDAASNNGVEEVRNLIDRVKYAPMQGQYKIYIIDEVHMMTKSAFNALLKTIEEPPKHIVFIFATTEPNKVLPTIISRCQRFDFSKVSAKDIAQRLTTVCEQEKIQIDAEAIGLIASLADGGMRDALSILD